MSTSITSKIFKLAALFAMAVILKLNWPSKERQHTKVILITFFVLYIIAEFLVIGGLIPEFFNLVDDEPKLEELLTKIEAAGIKTDGLKFYKGDKSYTINKRKVHMCMKDGRGKYYKDNMLMYVLLHELSHAHCKSIGHTKEFYIIFQGYLDHAEKAGIYDSSIPPVAGYCGTK